MKKERGSKTIITLTTILFLISFLISTYIIIANKRQAQEEIRRKTELLYESDVENAEEIYNGYFADANTVIPISNVDQLLKIGTNKYIVSGNKVYKCTPSARYKLVTSLKFNVKDYLTKYPDSFFELTYKKPQTTTTRTTLTNQVTNFSTVGSSTYEAPATGTYKLQVWGAEGGYRSGATYAGKGGYSTGTISLTKGEKLYVYVGGSGNSGTLSGNIYSGGYNGGGYRYKYKGGGGATDIRLTGGNWNDAASLKSRIIVAGGGGSDGATKKEGMYGGGTEGGTSTENYTANKNYCGQGGKQAYSGYSTSYTITSQATSGLNANSTANYCGGFGFGRWRGILK